MVIINIEKKATAWRYKGILYSISFSVDNNLKIEDPIITQIIKTAKIKPNNNNNNNNEIEAIIIVIITIHNNNNNNNKIIIIITTIIISDKLESIKI